MGTALQTGTAWSLWALCHRLEQHGRYGHCATDWNSRVGMGTVPQTGTAGSVWALCHRLENRGIEIRFPKEDRYFHLLGNVQTGSGAHAALKSMGTGISLTGHKAGEGRGGKVTTLLYPMPRLRMDGDIPPLHLNCVGRDLTFTTLLIWKMSVYLRSSICIRKLFDFEPDYHFN